MPKKRESSRLKYLLGMEGKITRRDFLNAALLGAGASLLEFPSPMRLFAQTQSWDGYGGIGDYANSHGNTEAVVRMGHGVRDGLYDGLSSGASDTGEVFDLVIIGGGLSGLGAAFYFKKAAGHKKKCLVIENHPIFGGEAKRNEFIVNGQRLIGPQGANSFVVIDEPDAFGYDIYSDLGIPQKFKYQALTGSDKKLRFDRTNYGYMLWFDEAADSGYFFGEGSAPGEKGWLRNIWENGLKETPFASKVMKDFNAWRDSPRRYYDDIDFELWLDTMTYKEYIEKVMGLDHEITKFVDPVLASSIGLGSDAISAYGAYQVAMPGFQGFRRGFSKRDRSSESGLHSFPGGNDGFSRYLIKALVPDAISGPNSFEAIMNGPVNFNALDRPENNTRIRLGAMAARIEQDQLPEKSGLVSVTYVKDGKAYRLKARGVIMANGGLTGRKIVKDLPEEYRAAYKSFYHSPMLVINVALTNWKFLYKLGLTSCRWFEGFGFSCNIRQPMIIGDYRPPLDPDRPAILTFYVPFYYPGLSIREQGTRGRAELLSASYQDYEIKIREQMVRLFGKAGFDPKNDIAGIILNRWGHAYVDPQPGFYFSRDGKPVPRDIIRKRLGRIAFAHSELNGHQHWIGAITEGQRAVKQIMEVL